MENENKVSDLSHKNEENNIVQKENKKQTFWELLRFAILAIIIVIPIRIFIAQPFVVSGSSMYPTFKNGDYLIVDEISYRIKEPKRYDVIVFRYPNDTKKFFIKRIIGLPNEVVDIKGKTITITNKKNQKGFDLDQSFIKNNSSNDIHFVLKENEYFVLGDNRIASYDSRYWGAVPRDFIIGRAFIRLLPINRINFLPVNYLSK